MAKKTAGKLKEKPRNINASGWKLLRRKPDGDFCSNNGCNIHRGFNKRNTLYRWVFPGRSSRSVEFKR